jgi:PAS domain S-box-containing protein
MSKRSRAARLEYTDRKGLPYNGAMRSAFGHIFLAVFLGAVPCRAQAVEPQPKRVLLLYAERSELPAIRAIDSGIREALAARGGVEVFAEYFDFARFPAESHSGPLIDLLRDRYGRRKVDLVVSTGYEALQFALAKREELFPGVPITYCAIERHQLEGSTLPADVDGVPLYYDFPGTVKLALKLQPGLREAVCVFGTSEFDRQVGKDALAALAGHPGLRVRQVDTVPYEGIIEQVRHLPRESMVFYVSMLRDAAGQTRYSPRVAEELSKASAVPVYGVAAHFLERGVLGGAMMDYSAHGHEAGALAVSRLNGLIPSAGDAATSTVMLNWLSLEKWGIAKNLIPEGSIVRFKRPSLWQERRGTIIGILSLVALQSALIAALLLNRSTRRRAELALAESEQRMGLAAEAAHLGMWAWDVSSDAPGSGGWMSEKGRALFGFQRGDRLDYAALVDRIHPDDRLPREAAVKRALETGEDYEMDYRLLMPNGGERWISARGRCLSGNNGRPAKLLGVSMDVTSRKQAELEAAQQRSELGHLSRVALVGEMATSLAHELNQPLTAIVTNASAAQRFIARSDMDPEELSELLADIAADGYRAGEVIRGIKGMVRKVESERRPLDLDDVIANVLRLVRADALAHGCAMASDLNGHLPPVLGDSVQLQQVLLNLVINAFDAMHDPPCDPCRVEITSRRADEQTIEVSVRDHGPGLPENAPIRVFERFYSTKSEGMGMGLVIARSIIEDHAGTLGAENAPGGGARFWFRLPVHGSSAVEVIA